MQQDTDKTDDNTSASTNFLYAHLDKDALNIVTKGVVTNICTVI